MGNIGAHQDSFHIRGVGSLGDYVDRTPVPSVAAFQDWIDNRPSKSQMRGRSGWTAYQIRRAVAMLRTHSTVADIARAVGKGHSSVASLLAQLPDDLK